MYVMALQALQAAAVLASADDCGVIFSLRDDHVSSTFLKEEEEEGEEEEEEEESNQLPYMVACRYSGAESNSQYSARGYYHQSTCRSWEG